MGVSACQAKDNIQIKTPTGALHSFSVQYAITPDEQAQGLMFVESMPMEEGMLFINDRERPTQFWMKNTLIPLDMLFFDVNKTLTHIEYSATPHDETPRGPKQGQNICYILEINGGLAKTLKIETGSKIIAINAPQCLHSHSK